MADKEAVKIFFDDLRQILKAGGKFYLIPREKNRDALLRMGFTIKNCRQEVMNLKVEDYCSEPDADLDLKFKGNVWTFGKKICERPVYIKVKVVKTGTHQAVICISFHEAEYPLRNVYR
ncbi:MAG: hypothetical protein ACOX2O_08845 [Bdellovibrionota bacterium]|jgi:hypothetical protein